jgi:hypothetical protein
MKGKYMLYFDFLGFQGFCTSSGRISRNSKESTLKREVSKFIYTKEMTIPNLLLLLHSVKYSRHTDTLTEVTEVVIHPIG